MDLAEIKHSIEGLNPDDEDDLLLWLRHREKARWDAELLNDFSEKGRGMKVLDKVIQKARAPRPRFWEHRHRDD